MANEAFGMEIPKPPKPKSQSKSQSKSKSRYNKDLALLNMLDEQTLIGLFNQEMGGDTFIDENRLKLQTRYPADLYPDERKIIDLAFTAIDNGENPNDVVTELVQRVNDPNDVDIPKIGDVNVMTDIISGIASSATQKMKSASSGKSQLDILTKLGVPEFAPLLTKLGKQSTPDVSLSNPYMGVPKEVTGYQNDLDKFLAQSSGLQKETTRGAKTDWKEIGIPKLTALENTPLDFLKGLEGKKVPVGKAMDVGSKALTFLGGFGKGLMVGGLPGALSQGGEALGKVNKTGTGWEKTWGSKTESPESVKKRQALALAAFKKNQQDIANREKWTNDALARQAKLSEMYRLGAASVPKPNIPSEYEVARALLAKAMTR